MMTRMVIDNDDDEADDVKGHKKHSLNSRFDWSHGTGCSHSMPSDEEGEEEGNVYDAAAADDEENVAMMMMAMMMMMIKDKEPGV